MNKEIPKKNIVNIDGYEVAEKFFREDRETISSDEVNELARYLVAKTINRLETLDEDSEGLSAQKRLIIVDIIGEFENNLIDNIAKPEDESGFYQPSDINNQIAEEAQSSFATLQAAVLDKVKTILYQEIEFNREDIFWIEGYFSSRVSMIKSFETGRRINRKYLEVDSQKRAEAFKRLDVALVKEPCSYISRPVVVANEENSQEVLEILDMDDLFSLIKEQNISFEQSIKFLGQAIKGAIYLLKHGLVLGDISLKNIGIDNSKQTAMLFDFDSLFLERDEIKTKFYSPGYRPLEWEVDQEQSITPATMTYQLGKCLENTLFYYRRFGVITEKYHALVKLMTCEDPNKRISLELASRLL